MSGPSACRAPWRRESVRLLTLLGCLAALLAAPSVRAQSSGLSLDLTDEAPAAGAQSSGLSLDLSGESSPATVGERIAVVPPHLPSGAVDLIAYRNLLSALTDHYGARIVPEKETLQALRARKLKPVALRAPVGARWVAGQLDAKHVIVFTAARRDVEIRVYATLGDTPEVELTQKWRARMGKGQAQGIVTELIEKADAALTPPPPPAIPERTIAAYSDPSPAAGTAGSPAISIPSSEKGPLSDVELEARMEEAQNAPKPWDRRMPVLVVAVGGGAATRELKVSGGEAIVPIESGTAPGLGLYLGFYPLQLSKGSADQPWSELLLEGHLRRSLVKATVRGGEQDGASSTIDDDEILVRLGWRYRIGKGLPGIGLSVGWASERFAFDSSLPAVSTRYSALSVQLRAQQPIVGEWLGLELMGGPRFLLAGDGAEAPVGSWDAEAWLASRPAGPFFARAGARVSASRLGREDGLEVRDLHTFFALELGAFVQ